MNLEALLATVREAKELAEYAEECMRRAEHPSISDCGEAFVCADGAANILADLERDILSELLQEAA